MALTVASPPESLCILRLSALGDVCHALPAVLAIQKHWPQTKITWVIGSIERQLLEGLVGVEFIAFNKSKGYRELLALRKRLAGRRFELLLHMQTSLRANLIAFVIPAKLKLGFDQQRARELHQWVINESIAVSSRQHQVDDFLDFASALGVPRGAPHWQIPIPQEAHEFARDHLSGAGPWLVVNAASSPSKRVHRNWPVERFVQVIAAVQQRGVHVALSGGPSEYEKQIAQRIAAQCQRPPVNLAGKTTLKQLAAVLARATLLLTTDSGPAHIATAVGTHVIALHAATNPLQTGPYRDLERVISCYPQSVAEEYGKPLEHLPWGIRAHGEQVMEKISSEEVSAKVLSFFSQKICRLG